MTALGEAGRRGPDIRSDLHVAVALTSSGGRRLSLSSKVAAYYGRAIEETVNGVLDAFDVAHADIAVEDQGALSFVIAARTETALRRAAVVPSGDPRPPVTAPRPVSDRERLRRSRLYLPGNEPKFMLNAGLHRPDGVILDLEDSVHPAEKDAARILVRNALRVLDFCGAERIVRINQLPLGLEDLDAIVPEDPDLVLIPKVEDPAQITAVDDRIREVQAKAGSTRSVWLMPIVESALGVERAFAIASASERVVALTIGLEDYTADLGVPKTAAGTESLYARTRIVNAARAAGVQPIDSVFSDVGDEEGLVRWAKASRALGFEGMGCIHPRQIGPIHEAFAPTAAELSRALAIVRAFEEAKARGEGVVSLGTRMVDAPVVKRAQRLVAWARRTGLLSAGGADVEEGTA